MFHNAFELTVESFLAIVAACYCVFRTADFVYDFNPGQPKGRRILYNDIALFIESKLTLGGIIGARLDLGIRIGIRENERMDFSIFLTIVKIVIGLNLFQFLVGQFDNIVITFIVNIAHFDFRTYFVKPPFHSFVSIRFN